jgi:hypothetical protein
VIVYESPNRKGTYSCREKYADLAAKYSLSERTVRRAVADARKRGLIETARISRFGTARDGSERWLRWILDIRFTKFTIRLARKVGRAPNFRLDQVHSLTLVNLARTREAVRSKPFKRRERGWLPFNVAAVRAEKYLSERPEPPSRSRGVVAFAVAQVEGLSAWERAVLGAHAKLVAADVSLVALYTAALRCAAAGKPWALRATLRSPAFQSWLIEQDAHRRQVRARIGHFRPRVVSDAQDCCEFEAAGHWLGVLSGRYGRRAA